MKYSNGLIISTAALAILTTGCVKKPTTETVVYDNSQPVYNNTQHQAVYDNTQPVYDTTSSTTQAVYEDAAPLIYDDAINNTSSSGVVYNDTTTDSTVITTDTYTPAPVIVDTASVNTTYPHATYPQSTTYPPQATDTYTTQPASSDTGAYNNPYGNDTSYPDPYASQSSSSSSSSSYPDPYATATSSYPSSSYGSSSSSSSSSQQGGIHLQIAALKDYYAAKEFKNSLSLDPKYSVYIKRGSLNKVIISGISSISEVNRLKERRFPGAFIVKGGSSYSSASSSSSSSSSSYNYETNYTVNNPYGTTTAVSHSGNSNGIGVQIGAYSSKSKARSVANSASSKYNGMVKSGRSNGKRIYKAILTGFSSEREARRFIANRGDGFLVHGL